MFICKGICNGSFASNCKVYISLRDRSRRPLKLYAENAIAGRLIQIVI